MASGTGVGDQIRYDRAILSDEPERYIISKEVPYIIDSGSGSYSGQIQFDTSNFSNNGRWCDYSQGWIEIPFVIAMKSSVDISAAGVNPFCVGLKNGHYQIINSMQVVYNNVNVVQVQQFSNFAINYRVLSSWSENDLKKWGDFCGVAPDSAGSFLYSAGAAAGGNGTSNNRTYDTPLTPYNGSAGLEMCNRGFLQRLRTNAFSTSVAQGGNATMTTSAQVQAVNKNYYAESSDAGADKVYYWNIMATIRLCDLHDFFAKLPIVKGASLQIYLNYNSVQQTIACVTGGPTMAISSTTQVYGQSNPILVASSAANNAMNGVQLTGNITISCGVKNTTSPTATNPMLNNCRLYVPNYALTADAEIKLLELAPKRIVRYEDIYQYTITGVSGNINSILTNGISGAKWLLIVPVLNSTAGNAATASLVPFQSCFDPCPGTTSPLASITNFNVQISGKNLFQQNYQYDYETYKSEVASLNALNGEEVLGLTSGLISKYMWDNCYRFYVANLSRRELFEDGKAKSIQVLGTNNTNKLMDYYCFVFYENVIEIDNKQV